MRLSLAAIVLSISVTGCASINKQAISDQEKSAIQGQSIVVTSREKPNFVSMTAGKAAFALVGAFAAISEGNSIVANNNIADPADFIASSLAKSLEDTHAVKLISPSIPVKSDDASLIASSAGTSAAYALDAQTIEWSINYFPTDWTHYRVAYLAKAQLINTKTKSAVASGSCKRFPESNAGAPTFEELMANQAARLKSELEIAAKECINTLKAEMLSIK